MSITLVKRNLKLKIASVMLIFFACPVTSQGLLYNRLFKIEQNTPQKIFTKAESYSKLYKKHPAPYYFMAKSMLIDFQHVTDKQKQSQLIKKVIINATKVVKYDKRNKIIETSAWINFKKEFKKDGYYYLKNNLSYGNNASLFERFSLFFTNNKFKYITDSQIDIDFPKDEINDTLYYGLPTGNEVIPQEFKSKEIEMIKLINEERKRLGLNPVKIDSALSAACRYHAYDMATQNYESHSGYDRGKDGKRYFANSTFERIAQFYDATTLINENIAFGSKNVEDMFNLWVESKGHYKNMLAPNSRVAGIGLVYVQNSKYQYYWVYNSAE